MNELESTKPRRAPDPILAELWEVKRQINAESGYEIARLVEMAHEAAVKLGKTAADSSESKSPDSV